MTAVEASSLFLREDDKKILTAKGMPDKATYSWQLLIPDTLIWTDIYGLDTSECVATRALIEGSYNKDGKAVLRCAAMLDGEAYFSDPVVIAPEMTVPEKAPLKVSTMSRPATVMRAPAADETREYVTITIKYLLNDTQGTVIHDSYVANLRYGASFNAVVPSPEYIGYSPYRIVSESGTETETNAETVELNYSELREDVEITVYYKPAESRYMVRYFFQNISDDGYTEDTTKSFTGYAVTGTYPQNEVEKNFEGFSTLFHEPDTIAADGSTEFNVYYDRNYYLYQFDCDGGYGTEPVYARYGTPLVVPAPTKPGYEFDKWVEVNADGTMGSEVTVFQTIEASNKEYKAIWKTLDTHYTLVYYLENPDDDDYSFLGIKIRENVQSGTEISVEDVFPDGVEFPEGEPDTDQYIYNRDKTESSWPKNADGSTAKITVNGDGSTVISVYFDRRRYELKFILGKEVTTKTTVYTRQQTGGWWNPTYTDWEADSDSVESKTDTRVVGGSTYHFGGGVGSSSSYQSKTDLNYLLEKNSSGWGSVNSITLNADYMTQNGIAGIEKETLKNDKTTNEQSKTEKTETETLEEYLYFTITKKYGASLYNAWPTTARIDPAACMGRTGYAVFSAWNGEYCIDYSRKQKNQTIKGRYLRLDNALLYSDGAVTSGNVDVYDPTDYRGNYRTHKGSDGNEVRELAFLAFWENGENNGWSFARKWIYETYIEPLPIELQEFQKNHAEDIEKLKKAASGSTPNFDENKYPEKIGEDSNGNPLYRYWVWYNGKNQYTATGDNSWENLKENDDDAGFYYMYDSFVCTDDNAASGYNTNKKQNNFYQQTPPGALGFEAKYGQYEDSELSENDKVYYYGDKQHTARFFYDRSTYALSFFNEGKQLSTDGNGFEIRSGRSIAIATNAIVHYKCRTPETITAFPTITDDASGTYTVDPYPTDYMAWLAPDYPDNLEPGAYTFGGWYRSQAYLPANKIDGDPDFTMPARNASLYAQWLPVSHAVTFSASYDAMLKGEYIDVSDEEDSKTLKIQHRQRIYTSDIPNTDEWKDVIGGNTKYNFVGWFYIDTNGVKHSFDPTKMTVDNDMHLYAEWSSSDIVDYTVHYVINGSEEKIADDFTGYTYAGTTKTFNAKAGDALFDGYRQGWYPTVSSHSIIVSDANKEFTFEYIQRDTVSCTVRYLEKGTNAVLKEEKTEATKDAVITEKFAPIEGYIPDAFYKTLTLSAYDNQNIITFYYTKNDKDALCVIEHYTESLTAGEYTLYSSNEVSGVIDQLQTAPALDIKGFTYDVEVAKEKNDKGIKVDKDGVSGTITAKGIVLKLYYTRNSYPYKVVYVDSENNDTVLETPVPNGSGKYGGTVTYKDAPDIYFDKGGNTRYKREEISPEKSLVVTDDVNQQIVFHYKPDRVDITYIPASRYSTIGGTLDIFIDENVYEINQIKGSTPTAREGYKFVGWYYDAQFENPVEKEWVSDSNKLTLGKLYYKGDAGVQLHQTNTYYALFEPMVGDLVIRKEVASPENCKDTFLFNVKGTSGTAGAGIDLTVSITGSGSVTVKDLPVGAYTVTELDGWSWKYDAVGETLQNATVADSDSNTATVTFTNSQNSKKWLGGESSNENKFEQNTETSD